MNAAKAMTRPAFRPGLLAAGLCALGLLPAWAGPHAHGVVYLDLAVDGSVLTVQMRAPLESRLGFERAPRTDAERQAASQMLAHLQQPQAVLQPLLAAGCEMQSAQVQAEVLQSPAQSAQSTKAGHADLQAQYQWRCARPDLLSAATVALFDSYRRTRKVEVQVAGPRGQTRTVLRPAARTVQLGR
jgi:hypothetical protein